MSTMGEVLPTLKALQAHRSVCEHIVSTTVPEELDYQSEESESETIIPDEEPATAAPTQRSNVFKRLNQTFGI